MPVLPREKIEKLSGWNPNLDGKVPYMRRVQIKVDNNLSVGGDAPKRFVYVYQYEKGVSKKKVRPQLWEAYIAKVGHKWYPLSQLPSSYLQTLGKLMGSRWPILIVL